MNSATDGFWKHWVSGPENLDMAASQIRKRVEKLAARICPSGGRQHTFEDPYRLMWRQDKRGFLALANGDCPHPARVRHFVRMRRRETCPGRTCTNTGPQGGEIATDMLR